MDDEARPKDPKMAALGKIPKRPRGERPPGSHKGPATLCGSAKGKGRPGTCRKGAGESTDHPGSGHCKWHGGTSPNGKTFAARQAAKAALEALGQPYGNGDPFALLRDVVRYSHGQTRAAAALVLDAVDHAKTPGSEPPIVPLDEAIRLLDRVLRTAGLTGKETVDADVADREVAIAQVQAEQMVAAFRRALEASGVTGETRVKAERALIAELRGVDAATGPVH